MKRTHGKYDSQLVAESCVHLPMDVITGTDVEGDLLGNIQEPLILQPGILRNMVYFDGMSSAVSYRNQRHR